MSNSSHEPTGESDSHIDVATRLSRAREIAESVLRRRSNGEQVSDAEILVRHRDLLPEIEIELRNVARIEAAKRVASAQTDVADKTQEMPTVSREHEEPGATSRPDVPGYELIREIGHGGQSIVYEARQISTGQTVAMKFLRDGAFASARDRSRFDREVQVLASIHHPNIVAIIDRGVAVGGGQFLVMDYIPGVNLQQWLDDFHKKSGSGDVDDPTAHIRLFLKICDAINAAHLRGIVHRDLKPANIRVDPRGEPHVIDFGLAHTGTVGAGGDAWPKTLTGQFLGSLPWASPEQAEGIPDTIDTRTDVYALGVLLYQLLTGVFPYRVAGTMRDVLNTIVTATPPPPSAVLASNAAKAERRAWRRLGRPKPAINASLDAIVLKALSKRRDDRYQTAGELANDVMNYLSGKPTVAGGVLPSRAGPRVIAAAVVLACIGLLLGMLRVSLSGRSASGPIRQQARQEQESAAGLGLGTSSSEVPTSAAGTMQPIPIDPIPSPSGEGLLPDALHSWISRIESQGGTVSRDAAGEIARVNLPAAIELDDELSVILHLPFLRVLRVANASDKAVAQLERVPTLERLEVVGAPITNAAFVNAKSWRALMSVQLNDTKVTDDGIRLLVNAPRFSGITIVNQSVSDQTLALIATPNMSGVELQNASISDSGLEALSRMPSLQVLGLAGSRIDGSGLTYVARAHKLEILDISSTAITGKSLVSLRGHPKLRELRLLNCKNISLASIVDLASMPALTRIVLPLRFRDGASDLVHTFGSRAGMRIEVRDEYNPGHGELAGLQVPGFLMAVGGPSAYVESVYISGKQINDRDVVNLTNLTELRKVEAIATSLTDASMSTLAACDKLEAVTLSDCRRVTYAGLKTLAKAPHLRTLTLKRAIAVSEKELADLRSARPDVSFVVEPSAEELR